MTYFHLISAISSIIIGLCICISLSTCNPLQPTCRGLAIHLTDEDLNGLLTCLSEMAPDVTIDEDASKISASVPKNEIACLGKCILAKEGLIDDKGMPSKENMMAKINATMPQEVVVEMDLAAAKCVDDHGKTVNPSDATCESYGGLTKCMQSALMELCKVKK